VKEKSKKTTGQKALLIDRSFREGSKKGWRIKGHGKGRKKAPEPTEKRDNRGNPPKQEEGVSASQKKKKAQTGLQEERLGNQENSGMASLWFSYEDRGEPSK